MCSMTEFLHSPFSYLPTTYGEFSESSLDFYHVFHVLSRLQICTPVEVQVHAHLTYLNMDTTSKSIAGIENIHNRKQETYCKNRMV